MKIMETTNLQLSRDSFRFFEQRLRYCLENIELKSTTENSKQFYRNEARSIREVFRLIGGRYMTNKKFECFDKRTDKLLGVFKGRYGVDAAQRCKETTGIDLYYIKPVEITDVSRNSVQK